MQNDIVQQLLRGSRNIDRMKKEVDETVRMILGMVKGDFIKSDRNGKFESGKCYWTVRQNNGRGMGQSDFTVTFVDGVYTIYSTEYGPKYTQTDGIQTAHQNLSFFVEGMIGIFPDLKNKLQPFIKAADVF